MDATRRATALTAAEIGAAWARDRWGRVRHWRHELPFVHNRRSPVRDTWGRTLYGDESNEDAEIDEAMFFERRNPGTRWRPILEAAKREWESCRRSGACPPSNSRFAAALLDDAAAIDADPR